MTRTKIILGVLLLAVIIPTASAVSLPSLFDEPCSGSPSITQICQGVNAINDELEAQILRIDSLNATDIAFIAALGVAVDDQAIINATTQDNEQRLDDILFNSTSFNGTSFVEIDAEQAIQDADISTLESSVSSIQTQANTHDTDIAAIHEHIDVTNRNIAFGPLPVPQLETDYTAICNDGSQTKMFGSGVGTLTNGVNTTSNIPELIIGTISNVTVNYTDTRLTFKMTVTNPDDITGLTGEAFLTCVTYPN